MERGNLKATPVVRYHQPPISEEPYGRLFPRWLKEVDLSG